jgi:transposase
MSNELAGHYALLLGLDAPWEVRKVDLQMAQRRVVIDVGLAKGAKVPCPECGQLCGLYDQGEERTWRHLDTMQFETRLRARVPRSNCPEHGAKSTEVPWAGKNARLTWLLTEFALALLQMSESVQAVAELLGLDWHTVQELQARAVERGLQRRAQPQADAAQLRRVEHLGLDEKSFRRGQDYVSIVCDLNNRRVLEVAPARTQVAGQAVLEKALPEEQRGQVQAIAIDLAEGYVQAARAVLPQAAIVHDRFHLERYLSRAVDVVRREEQKRAWREEGDESLKGTRWFWLRKFVTLKKILDEEGLRAFAAMRQASKVVGRAWQRKEIFGAFFQQPTRAMAERVLERWCNSAQRSRLAPMVAAAKSFRRHREGILAFFDHHITTALCEGFNAVIETIKKNARGFGRFDHFRVRILFRLGKLDLRTPAAVREATLQPA